MDINESKGFISGTVEKFVQELACKYGAHVGTYLLGAIFLQLRELTVSVDSSVFGATKFDIKPVALTTTSQKILEREKTGKVRKVSIWVDAASGGPTPTIRVGKSATSSSGGGVRVNAGQVNELGEVPPDVELYAVASTAINAYVLEHA